MKAGMPCPRCGGQVLQSRVIDLERRGAKIGDRITLTIKGPTTLAGTLDIGAGAAMTAPGKIVADRGESWLVQLDITVSGQNLILVPKAAIEAST